MRARARISRRCRHRRPKLPSRAAWARKTYQSMCGAATRGASLTFENVPGVPQISCQGDEGGGQQHTPREVLDQHEQTIPFHVVSLNWRGAAGGMRVMVLHHGLGGVETFPTGPAGAQPEIGIFTVE